MLFAAAAIAAVVLEPSLETVLGRVADILLVTSGSIIAWKTDQQSIGWILVALGFIFSLATGVLTAVAESGGGASQGLLDALIAVLVLLIYLILIFPSGRLPSRLARVVAVGSVIGGVLVAVVEYRLSVSSPDSDSFFGVLVFAALMAVAVLVQILHLKHRSAVERKQLKWFLYALAVSATIYIVMGIGGVPDDIFLLGDAVATSLWPVAILVAITRYRLYEIDRVVSKSVAYAIVVGLIAAVYLIGAVWLPTQLVGEQSPVFVAGTTLAIAALFDPARRRVVGWVDRRFNRSRYDAEKVITAFSDRLRDEVDMDRLASDSLAVVDETVQPSTVGIWMRSEA